MNAWRILLVENEEDDYILTRQMLAEARDSQFELSWVRGYDDALAAFQEGAFDAMLVDYQLDDHDGLQLVRLLSESGNRLPMILLTGYGSYDIDVLAMGAGAVDSLSKGEASGPLLERAIRHAIEQKSSEEALRQANDRLAQAWDDLEARVQERTVALEQANLHLEGANTELVAEIAERQRVEAELAEIQRRLLDSIEGERFQLAQELHDGPLQELYALMYQVSALAKQLSTDQATSFKANLQHVVQSLREIAGELRPPALAPFGLEKAIRSQVDQVRHTHPDLKFDLRLAQDGKQLPERVRLALFRILQVGLANVLRHARAGSVGIRFDLDSRQARLEISDDGCGFDVPRRMIEMARQSHFGLVGANERAAAVGGKLTLESAPGKGTTLRVVVPR